MKYQRPLILLTSLLSISFRANSQQLPSLPQMPSTRPSVPHPKQNENQFSSFNDSSKSSQKNSIKKSTSDSTPTKETPSDNVPHGLELVSIDFPNGVNLSDIIRTIGMWSGKNFVLGQGVSGSSKISIISQDLVTKEEAYQAFLSALNISGFTTVETGKIVKILPISNARSSNIKTYYGENWAPATDEIINQVVPLQYIDVKVVVEQLRPLLGLTPNTPFTTTNSLILTDTGNRIRRILEIIKLLDNKKSQSQVTIVPVNYSDAKEMATKITEIFGSKGGNSISLQKTIVDERTNSLILVGPSHTLDDVVRFIQKMDKPALNETAQTLIHVRPLDYADAEKLAQTLQALSQNTNASSSKSSSSNIPGNNQRPPFLPPLPNSQPQAATASNSEITAASLNGVKITSDKATNSLIIEGSNSAFNELDSIIAQLDKRRAQVYIESIMLDLNMSNKLNWSPSSLAGIKGGNAIVPFGFNAGGGISGISETPPSLSASALSSGILGILSNTTISLGGLSLTPGALIYALKTDNESNILQTPSMMVSDNETANFDSTQEYSVLIATPNPNGSQGIVQTPQTFNVTSSLKVTPQISRANYVNLKIALQLDSVGGFRPDNAPSLINKRKADSLVTVQNGQTAVLGGITSEKNIVDETKVPILGDIPIVGWLFKTVSHQKEKSSLTLFVTPHIVRDADDLAKIYEKKMQDRDEFLKAFYGPKVKEEDFYASYPQAEDGKARHSDDSDTKEKKKNEPIIEQKVKRLPSQDANPINAPLSNAPAGNSFINPTMPSPDFNAPSNMPGAETQLPQMQIMQ